MIGTIQIQEKIMTILYSGQSDGGPSEGGFGATLPPYNKDSLGKSGFLDQPYWNKKVYTVMILQCVHIQVR